MKKLIFIIIAATFVLFSNTVNAADSRLVHVVYTVDTHGDTQGYLKVLKPLIDRVKQLSPKTVITVHEARYAGADTGAVYVIVEQPSLTYMDQLGPKIDNDPEIQKLFPKLGEISTLKGVSLYMDRAPDQARDMVKPIEIVYAVNTHGKTAEYLAATKKIDARFMALNKKAAVRVFESTYSGTEAGTILVVVQMPNLAYMDEEAARSGNDAELMNLFTAREGLGATVESVSLMADITP